MKKLTALLIALALVLTCAAGLAEASEKPILFRGFDWGVSYTEIAKTVDLTGFFGVYRSYTVADLIYDGDQGDYTDGITISANFTDEEIASLKVAGYDVLDVFMIFAYTPDASGKLVKDADHTALYYALYKIKYTDKAAAKQDLINKLTSLYGDVDMETGEYTVWYGAEGTLVSLDDNPNDALYIKYSFWGGEDLLQAADRAENPGKYAGNTQRQPAEQEVPQTTDKEILFRGFDWGTTYAEISNTVSLTGLSNSLLRTYSVPDLIYDGDDGNWADGLAGCTHYASDEISAIQVAGYSVKDVFMIFAYLPDGGAIVKDENHAALYYALYNINFTDKAAAKEDLKKKLSSLYGEIGLSTGEYDVWAGANGTLVSLNDNPNGDLYIKYSFYGGEQMLQAGQDALNGGSTGGMDTAGL